MNNKRTEILLIEDNPGDARLIREVLGELAQVEYQLESAGLLSKGLECLVRGGIDVVLLDLGLPDSQGLDTLGKVATQAPAIPIVVLTGLDDETLAVQAVRQGAQDYLVKGDVDSKVLWRVMRYAVERKRAEEALRESEQNYRSIFETANDAIYVHDINTGAILDVNQAACELHKLTKEQMLSLSLEELSIGESPYSEKEIAQWVQKVTKEGPQLFEWLGKKKDGELMWEEINLKKAVIGGKDRILAIARDITERKKMQLQLIQTEKLSALGLIAAGISHELLNPMMGMLNFAEYCLEHTAKDDPKHRILQDMERETERCIDIVKNLLTFAPMEKEGEEKYGRASFATIIDRAVRLLSYRIEKEHILLTQHIAEGTPEVWMDASGMQQVFLNIIGNAIDTVKESEKKEIRVEVHPEGKSVLVTIADSGRGISPENMEKIFDPFFTTKLVGQGTGLGLTISQNIILGHGGSITCESKPDAGTVFSILLPTERIKERRME